MAGGKTLAVLGCGINTRYNLENEGLRKVISTSGALISEYPPGAPPLSYHFPVRNRLISALSLGVIVVEAGARSGSLITANLALEQGKDIFAVPGEINHAQAKGVNRLISDGAKSIEKAYDVLEEYVVQYPHRLRLENLGNRYAMIPDKGVRPKWEYKAEPKRAAKQAEPPAKPEKKKTRTNGSNCAEKSLKDIPQTAVPERTENQYPIGMSEGAVKVLETLDSMPKQLDELIDTLGMSAADIVRYITELELYGLVKSLPGKRYSKNG